MLLINVKIKEWKMGQIFVAFSEYLNFNKDHPSPKVLSPHCLFKNKIRSMTWHFSWVEFPDHDLVDKCRSEVK